MLIIPQFANNKKFMSSSDKPQVITINARYRLIGIFVLGATVMIGISGCGQKGALYLADTDSQMVTSSSDMLDSTSNPQDAAFAGIDDDEYQKTRYLEQKQVLPDVSDDPNDY